MTDVKEVVRSEYRAQVSALMDDHEKDRLIHNLCADNNLKYEDYKQLCIELLNKVDDC